MLASIIQYVLSALLILTGIAALFSNNAVGLFFMLSGLLLAPVVRQKAQARQKKWDMPHWPDIRFYQLAMASFVAAFVGITMLAEPEEKLWAGVPESRYLELDALALFCRVQEISEQLNQDQLRLFGANPAEALNVGDTYEAGGELVVSPYAPGIDPEAMEDATAVLASIRRLPVGTPFKILDKVRSDSYLDYKVRLPSFEGVEAWVRADSMMNWESIRAQVMGHAQISQDWRATEFERRKEEIWPPDSNLRYSYLSVIANSHDVSCPRSRSSGR